MRPVVPLNEPPNSSFREIGLGQEKYLVLPAYISRTDGMLTSEWELDDADIAEIIKSKRITVRMLTFGKSITPIQLEVTHAPS